MPVFLAPMAGITDLPFRTLVNRFGAGLTVSEMVASQEMVQARPSARARAELGGANSPRAVQIAGRDAYWMAECARLCAANGAELIDINMGCPAKKVTNGYSGSALMREPAFALTLIEAVVAAVDVPVTLKMRLGWDDDHLNASEIARMAEASGVQMITIHGRTRCQFYKGSANWQAIAAVKDAVRVPVIANGDVIDSASAKEALKLSGADGVMIGRGAQGKPWLLAQIASELAGKPAPQSPDLTEMSRIMIEHYEAMLSFYGGELGVKVARKHLGWYLDPFPELYPIRGAVLRERDSSRVIGALEQIPMSQPAEAA
jgi:nifR3 family TIM-barrel protein